MRIRTTPDTRLAFAVGLTVLAFVLATTSLSFVSIDETAVLSVARSLAGHGGLDGDILYWTGPALGVSTVVVGGPDGHVYVVKDILPSLVITPLVWLAARLHISPVRLVLLLPPLLTAFTAILLVRTARRLGLSRRAAMASGLIFGLCSPAWLYAETLFTQPFATLGLVIALWAALRAADTGGWRDALICGAGVGLAGASATPLWSTGTVYALFLLLASRGGRSPAQWFRAVWPLLLAFSISGGVFLGAQGVFNAARFGSPWETGHAELGAIRMSAANLPVGLTGLLFSTPRGLLWYAPFVLLLPFIRGRLPRPARWLIAGIVLIVLGVYSLYGEWFGGLAWGPRFLVPLMPLLALLVAPVADDLSARRPWHSMAIAAVLMLSLLTQAGVALAGYLESESAITGRIREAGATLSPALFDPSSLPLLRSLTALSGGIWSTLWFNADAVDGWLLAGCLIVALTACGTLLQVARGSTGNVLAAPAILSGGLALLMLIRYPVDALALPALSPARDYIRLNAQPGEAVLVQLPVSIFGWIDDSAPERPPDYGVVVEDPLSEPATAYLRATSERHSALWLVSEGTINGDPANGVEHWLAENGCAGPEVWFEGYRVIPYLFPRAMQAGAVAEWQDGMIRLSRAEYALDRRRIILRLNWQVETPPAVPYTVFVHMLNLDGTLIAQHDGQPEAGYRPAMTWQPGETIPDCHALLLPGDLPSGEYRLVAGLYHPANGERLSLTDGGNAAEIARFGMGGE
ncbi:MAG: hypothetical protein IT326_03290 [Anaerolineae bacterium]|nr:hypothetical protein [Anaerolineae bacterium]